MGKGNSAALRVLIVDDEPLAIERLTMLCDDVDGIEIVGKASDGHEALERIEKLSPDCVLLDLTMPEMDGMAVARAVKRLAERGTAAPAVVFVTAHDDFAVQAFDLDAVDYLLKPVTPDRLERAMARVRERGNVAASPISDWLSELWVPNRGN